MDKRTLEKYEKEAREKNRETWYLSWALDTNQEERDKVGAMRTLGSKVKHSSPKVEYPQFKGQVSQFKGQWRL